MNKNQKKYISNAIVVMSYITNKAISMAPKEDKEDINELGVNALSVIASVCQIPLEMLEESKSVILKHGEMKLQNQLKEKSKQHHE